MNTENHDQDPANRVLELLATGARAELELLRRERKAERRLADALEALGGDKARLRKTQQRIERSREAVAAAQARLREAQESRAVGPAGRQD
jgi:hypothetical protein